MGMTSRATGSAPGGDPLSTRLAPALFLAHLALIAFSTIALTTFLAGPPPEWMATEPNATVARIAWKFSGPTYVVLGALAALAHATGRLGWRRATALLAAGSLIALASELLGTSTGIPFGAYEYTPLLGWRIGGLVPFPIPISWFYMIYGSLAICGRLLPARDDSAMKWRWAIVAGLVLTAWDISMDPAMVHTAHWVWHTAGFFYGMPLTNWIGWMVTGTLIARVMLAIAPPSAFARRVSPSALPILLYLANGIMPIALCVRDGLTWAAVLGTIAMALPAGAALLGASRRAAAADGEAARVGA
jgi:putative membrane protein